MILKNCFHLLILTSALFVKSSNAYDFDGNFHLLGKGWGMGHDVIAPACNTLECISFSFVYWSPGQKAQKISPDFPLPLGKEAVRKEYLKRLFKALYQSETEDEVSILFNFSTQGFGRITEASADQRGWNWASTPVPLTPYAFESLKKRIEGKGEFWFSAKKWCRNWKRLFNAVEQESFHSSTAHNLDSYRETFHAKCDKTPVDQEVFQENVLSDGF